MSRKMKVAACCVTMTIVLSGGIALGRGFRGGGGGGFRGGGGGYRGGGEVRGGYGGGFGGGGGYGGMSHLSSAPSRSSYQRPESGYGSFNGRNPYAGGVGGGFESGSRSGSYTTRQGGTIDYGAAGIGGRGDQGDAAGRGVYGIQGTTAGGRDYTDVGRAGGVVGPGGDAVGGRSNLGAVSGPNGVAIGGSRGVAGVSPEGAVRVGERGGVAAGGGGAVAVGSRGGVAVGAGGAVSGRGYGVAGYHTYGNNVYAANHQGWVHGCWNGHGSAWGWGYPGWAGVGLAVGLGWGLASWGYGSSLYGMGYMPYANPYYSAPMFTSVGYDYSQPIDTTIAPPEDSVASPAVASFDAARDSFKQGSYNQALQQAGDALAKTPNDSDLHEFRGLCLFALKRYDESAAALYGVLSVGPGWDWTTLVGLYPDIETYTRQLRTLEGYCVANPGSASARFVLAYHYLSEGQPEAAAGILQQVVALKPDDTLSAKLLRQLAPPKDTPAASQEGTAAPVPANSALPAGVEIAGTWVARPVAGTTISLAIQPGGEFTWDVEQGGRSQQFAGASTYGSGLLTLARTGGPALVGRVSWKNRDHMTFRIVGDGPDDPGLVFAR